MANDGTNGRELWKSDGTAAGTVRVIDLVPGAGDASLYGLENVNGTLFFHANADGKGSELWKSDGTSDGTVLAADIFPGGNGSAPNALQNVNGSLFFSANDGTTGEELWKSDGTDDGTTRVTDLRSGPISSDVGDMININGTLFFSANDGNHGQELWVFHPDIEVALLSIAADNASQPEGNSGNTTFSFTVSRTGSGNGTVTADFAVTGRGANPANAADFGGSFPSGTLSFAPGEMTKTITFNVSSDSTLEPDEDFTVTLSNVPGIGLGTGAVAATILNDEPLLVMATSSVSKSEGQIGNTPFSFVVTRIGNTQGTASVDFAVTSSATANDFGGAFPAGTIDFADGESAKTITINVSGDTDYESDENFTVTLSNAIGAALGTATATGAILNDDITVLDITSRLRLFDFRLGSSSSSPRDLMNINGDLYFLADRGAPVTELWRTDGTPVGTALVKERVASNTVTNVNGTLFFQSENPETGWELWKSDGTTTGTMLVKDIAPGSAGSVTSSYPMMNVNGTLFFGADSGGTGLELWKSDGTASGTVLIKDILPGDESSYPNPVANVNGTLYFRVYDGDSYPLWKSDGTEAGTVLVEDVSVGRSEIVQAGDTKFLTFKTGATGTELWKTSGTSGEPVLVKDIRAGSVASDPRFLTNVNGTLFFSADDGMGGAQPKLWKSDGTAAGTVVVSDIRPNTNRNNPNKPLENVNGTLFFASVDGLWKTDGTAAGTVLVKSDAGFQPGHLTNFDGMLYFTAYDGQLWKSDGTSAGTVLAYDVRSGSENSGQERLIEAGGNLFFTANDGSRGQELFVLHPGPEIAIVSIAPTNAVQSEGDSGNKSFTFTVTRANDPSTAVSVDFTVAGAGANAAAAEDFGSTLPSGTINFAAGEMTKILTIDVSGDSTIELDESFTVTLSNVVGAELGTSSASGTILTDDTWLSIDESGESRAEGTGTGTSLTFTITRTGNTSGTTTANFAVTGTGVHAADAADFGSTLPSGAINFAAGQTTRTITINISGDGIIEPDEQFTATLSNVVGVNLGTSSTMATILDDDKAVLRVGVDLSGNLSLIENGNGESDDVAITFDSGAGEYVISSSVADALTTDNTTYSNIVRIDASRVTGGLFADLGAGDDRVDLSAILANLLTVTVHGAAGNDTLIGGLGNDVLDGGDGDDSLSAGNGDDSLLGGAGSDLLFGGGGIDLLDGGEGNDVLRGHGGIDTLTGGAGNDTLDGGGSGKDVLRETANVNFTLNNTRLVGLGTDKLLGLECAQLTGGAGDNALDATAFSGSVTLIGGNGKDTLIGGAGHDLLKGDSLPGVGGRDYLVGNSGRDTLLGGKDGDTLIGGSGHDLIEGEEDGDVIRGGGGNDTLRGGTGGDALSETTGGSLTLTNSSLNGLGVDVLEQIETVILIGNANANRLDASAATMPIVLKGGGGDDTLLGGSNRDQLIGGDGNDLVFGNGNYDTLSGGNGDDSLCGGIGNDFLFGEAGTDVLVGDAGIDTLQGGNASDTLAGGSGTGVDAGDVLNPDSDDLIDEANPFTADWIGRLSW